MNEYLKEYQALTIWRQAIILLMAAPIPAAIIKLQGELLNAEVIGIILISGNLFIMSSHYLNKVLTWKQAMIAANVISLIASGALLTGWLLGVGDRFLIIWFPISIGLGYLFLEIASNKIKNIIKDRAGQEFDLAYYESKKRSVSAGTAIVGQFLGIVFYMTVDTDPMTVLVVIEVVKTIVYTSSEFGRYRLISKIEG